MNTILTGQKFGRWTVIEPAPFRLRQNGKKRHFWLCECSCGKTTEVEHYNLLNGISESCGCARVEGLVERCTTHGCAEYGAPTPEYRAWQAMINRCVNPNYQKYSLYGGRGISVCEQWKNSFEAFLQHMGVRPSSKHTLDRIKTNGNYEPGNCRWATWTEQQNNRRDNLLIEWGGKTQTAAQWEQEFGWNSVLANRINRYGWPIQKAMTTAPQTK